MSRVKQKTKKKFEFLTLFKKRLTFIFLVGILLLGVLLRSHDLYTWPRLGATFDEYAWTWQGMSLIQNKVPTSWSYHPQYKNKKLIKYQKTNFVMVTPYLEHPPVFGLVAGSYAILNGAKNLYDVDLGKIRGLALILGTISIFLVFLLSSKLYGRGVGLISALLYATVPTVVVGSRIVENENFFIPMWLLTLYLTVLYLKNKKGWIRNSIGVLCGLLILSKVPWGAAAFSVAIIFLYNKRYKDIVIFCSIVIAMFLLYFGYGFYYDKEVFLGLWGLQLNRYDITFASIYALIQKPYLADRFYLDGWILAGWAAFLLLVVNDFKKNVVLISVVLSYFLVFLTGIPDEAGHGWYRYPFYPFLIISTAVFIKEYFAKNFVLTFLFLVCVGTSLFELTWGAAFGFSYFVFRFLILTWGLILIPQYLPNKFTFKIARLTSYSWLGLYILISVWAVLTYNEQ